MYLYLALLLHRDYFRRPDSSLSCSFVPQGLFPPSGFISILLFCSTGIISAARIHLYLPLLSHRDYFRRSDSSLSCSFAPQGLFRPARCISILLFSSAGIILPRPDASLSSSFASQGLFPPAGFIPSLLFCSTGIISASRIHLYLALFFHRDYFHRPDSSLSCSFLPQGLFCPARMHLYLALLLHRDYFRRPNASLSCSFAPQGLFRPARCISVLLFCSTEIISTVRMHLYLAFLFHRDYFHRPNASLSSSFVPQGLFPPPGFISIFLFCSTGIISTGRMHLYLALFFHRDYFRRSDSSLSCSFLPQGLFPPPGFISILLFSSTGIILPRPNASLSCSFAPQRLFPPPECISILLFCSTGIISTGQMHLCLAFLFHRDYFHRPDASLSCFSVPQRLFPPSECISIFLFCPTGIISAARIHLYLPLLLHRDYFRRPDSSLSSSFAPQGLFPPPRFIPTLLFFTTGIISAARIHLYLPLLLHKDYFHQPNASLIRAPVKYQRPNFYYTGNTRMASADTLCKNFPQDRQKTKCFISFYFIFLPIW